MLLKGLEFSVRIILVILYPLIELDRKFVSKVMQLLWKIAGLPHMTKIQF